MNLQPIKVLFVGDDAAWAGLLQDMLRPSRRSSRPPSGTSMKHGGNSLPVHSIPAYSIFASPDRTGLGTYRDLRDLAPDLPIVVLAAV